MKAKPMPQLVTLTVTAAVSGDRAVLLDKSGRKVGHVKISRIGQLGDRAAREYLWHVWARSVIGRYGFRLQMKLLDDTYDDWHRKARALAASFRLRKHNVPRRTERRRLNRHVTTTWWEAAKRMVWQGHNRFRYRVRSGWVRWANTVSRNQNKRVSERYGTE